MGSNEDMLDVFESGLGAVFDEPLFAIGSPGECYEHSFETHLVSRFPSKEGASSNHNLKLSLPTPKEDSEIGNGNVPVEDALVIEFGAGVGLCGLVAAKCGAKQVLATDYPDEGIIFTLAVNYKNIFGEECRWVDGKDVWWNVLGHAWGEASSLGKIISYINPESVTPIVIFMADLLWIPTAHMALLSDIYAILSLAPKSSTNIKSKAHITAGLHTSRETIDAFFKKARDSFGFIVKKIGEVRVGSFGLEDGIVEVGEDVPVERRDLERSDPSERKKWVLYYEIADIGLIGLAVMGQNLILNMNDHGFTVCAYNRTVEKVDQFLANEAKGTNIIGARSIQDLCSKLKTPRKIMLLVKAGQAVDDFIAQIIPFLEKGDIIIDGGNSHFPDSIRRVKELEAKGFLFVGAGVSGGEEGARYGPSLMPGGSPAAWPHIQPIFQAIAAKTSSGEACCDWVGEGGSGHYVKMVHNGIEYGDMQIICEAYQLLKDVVGLNHDEMSEVFNQWNQGELDSFLIEITRDILKFKDEDGKPLVEKIRDTAGQKGTGKWTAISALDLDERVAASKILQGPDAKFSGDKAAMIEDIRQAMYAAKIISYAQGFMELREAARRRLELELRRYRPHVERRMHYPRFLGDITNAFKSNPSLQNLLLDPFFTQVIHRCVPSFRRVVSQSVLLGVPVPAFSTALSFYDGYRSARVPANLLQAQRDYFGAHTYQLESAGEKGEWIHTNWTGRGGRVASSTYQV
ncbi:decarboxylating 6-phosphogluconate dehydrogenase [Rhizoclosmatium globosum]|uniref:6-phosphogluconate dehydrogenase, decarboxylating n=1 Tax=Rhizoclosmatium globosum TaxID=329046 RepID=A0A1Y2C5B6_9FUNG|nr:decarboxylating 6-phosphogluconate dehydrogenase [Rhizoclosmatium globosum]|eukprot:ORY42221.1 decarboxylating 6-phosphogluconate dehydrogenase [Rhizoclosmatium globosum]